MCFVKTSVGLARVYYLCRRPSGVLERTHVRVSNAFLGFKKNVAFLCWFRSRRLSNAEKEFKMGVGCLSETDKIRQINIDIYEIGTTQVVFYKHRSWKRAPHVVWAQAIG